MRLSSEEEKLLDDEGKLCLGESAASQTLKDGIDDNLVELNTTVKYSDGRMLKLFGVNNTVSLEDIKDEKFEVTSRARYNTSIVAETTCTQVEKTVKGTMITMYETNPNAASQPGDQTRDQTWLVPDAAAADRRVLLPAVIALLALINVVAY